MSTDLMDLASRVEAGEGPDRELDALIAPLQGLRVVDEGHPLGRCCYDADNSVVRLPAYTASLDAAMSLLDDYRQTGPNQFGFAPSLLRRHDGTACADVHISPSGDMVSAQGATPALALTAAALRARAHQGSAHVEQ